MRGFFTGFYLASALCIMHLLFFAEGVAYIPLPRDNAFYRAFLGTSFRFRLSRNVDPFHLCRLFG
ncbi:hypothetical protein A2U01_0059628 [Trifolium medium]|uniref:Uncharacterized protein n=1 Tax=Trifolium medium TaxID=97028 RepID=A0A392RRJ7_9FABA|nr:hypothetical protein [Trifolium medium]